MKTRLLIIIIIIATIGFFTIPFYATNIYCDVFDSANGGCIRIASIGPIDYTYLPLFYVDFLYDEKCMSNDALIDCEVAEHFQNISDVKRNLGCAKKFDESLSSWGKSLLDSYLGDLQPSLEPLPKRFLLLEHEHFAEWRDGGCVGIIYDWAYLSENEDYIWNSGIDWKLETSKN